MAGPKTVVCLCQDVTAEDLERLARQGFDSSETLKRITGALTGPCQGKYCAPAVLRTLRELAVPAEDQGRTRRPAVRPPLAPVLLGYLVQRDSAPGSGDGTA